MIERAARDRAKAALRRAGIRRPLPAALAFLFVTVVVAAFAGVPYLFQGETLETEVAAQIKATVGLDMSSKSVGRLELLPRPRIAVDGLHVTDPTGTLAIDADELVGDIRLLPLIVGRIELASATLVKPRLVVDLNGAPMSADSVIGRAVHADGASLDKGRRLGILTLVNGTALIKGGALPKPIRIDALDMTLDWRDLDSPATLTGTLSLGADETSIAAWFAQPSNLMRGDHSAVALHLRSPYATLSANGDLSGRAAVQFRGHASATAPSGAALLTLVGSPVARLAAFANLSVDGDTSLSMDSTGRLSLDLQNFAARADGNSYEGTFALNTGDRTAISATLATDNLNVTPFLARLPALIDTRHQWSDDPLVGSDPHLLDLDVRLSAGHLQVAPFLIGDAALAIITRNARTEIALIEGKAYGGQAKARLSIGLTPDNVSLRGTGSLTEADLGALSWDATGRQLATGTASLTAALETDGDSAADLVRQLHGTVKATTDNGELQFVDLSRILNGQGTPEVLRGGRTSFSELSSTASFNEGVATIDHTILRAAEGDLSLSGTADLAARTLDLHAAALGHNDAHKRPVGFDVGGSFEHPRFKIRPAEIAPPKVP
jgi:AsmA protein